jgi:hypothetical protein
LYRGSQARAWYLVADDLISSDLLSDPALFRTHGSQLKIYSSDDDDVK